MRFRHHDLEFELDEERWSAAGMDGWKPSSPSYRVDHDRFPNTFEVSIADVDPLRQRRLSHGIFNDDAETGRSARDRVIEILRGFVEDVAIPPVQIVRIPGCGPRMYRLYHGAHRFYLSIAAGFTHVPALKGKDV